MAVAAARRPDRPQRVPRHRLLAGVRADGRRREGAGPGDAARQPDHLDDGRPGRDRRHAGRPDARPRSSPPRTCWCGPVLPRFFVDGDQAEIAAVVHNTTRPQPRTWRSTSGATGLDLPGKTGGTVTIPAGGTYKAVWPVETVRRRGRGRREHAAPTGAHGQAAATRSRSPCRSSATPRRRWSAPAARWSLASDALELVRAAGGRRPDTRRAGRHHRAEPGRGHGRRADLPGALPVRVRRADHEPLPAQRRHLPRR